MRALFSAVVLAAVLAAPSVAQDDELTRPSDWQVRFDNPAADADIYFVDMPPGWHITTGPSGILYNPATTATAPYRIESEIFLFPAERREGFGIIFGGTDLAGDGQSYTYFLIRKDGQFIIKQRRGSETSTHVPWTAHEAVVPHDGGEGTAKNVLAVTAGETDVVLAVNGQEVARLERGSVATDGVVGLRVNHRLNIHVASLNVEQ